MMATTTMTLFQYMCVSFLLLLIFCTTVATTVTTAAATATKDTSTIQPPPMTQKYLLVGVSGGLQDGFPERNKMDFVDPETATTVRAIFVGKTLIRGYKAYLDVMEVGYRQYVVCCLHREVVDACERCFGKNGMVFVDGHVSICT
jgi:prepilin-type processing-associated H-X9-DG protein